MRSEVRAAAVALLLLMTAACGGGVDRPESPGPGAGGPNGPAVADFPVKIGQPYSVGNTTYTPEDVTAYDEVGYASWYGRELVGRTTANGESFAPAAVSGAHKTLPLPSYVEVTALDTGRTILVRINDRGPFANDRLVDLSEGAARQLGTIAQGSAGVRVRKVNPVEQERVLLRNGTAAAERIETPESLLRVLRNKLALLPKPRSTAATVTPRGGDAQRPVRRSGDGRFIIEGQRDENRLSQRPAPAAVARPSTPAPTTAPPAATNGGYFVQVAAFSDRGRAVALASRIDARVTGSGSGLHRVRIGPYDSVRAAESGLEKVRKQGYPDARILHE